MLFLLRNKEKSVKPWLHARLVQVCVCLNVDGQKGWKIHIGTIKKKKDMDEYVYSDVVNFFFSLELQKNRLLCK